MGVRCLMAVMGPNVSWDGDGPSALAPLFGNIIDNVPLGLNSKFTLVVILVVYWIITF